MRRAMRVTSGIWPALSESENIMSNAAGMAAGGM